MNIEDSVIKVEEPSTTDNGLIIAIVIASIVVVCAAVGGGIMCWRNSHTFDIKGSTDAEQSLQNRPSATNPGGQPQQHMTSFTNPGGQSHNQSHNQAHNQAQNQQYDQQYDQHQSGQYDSHGQQDGARMHAHSRYNLPIIPVQSSPYDNNYFYR